MMVPIEIRNLLRKMKYIYLFLYGGVIENDDDQKKKISFYWVRPCLTRIFL